MREDNNPGLPLQLYYLRQRLYNHMHRYGYSLIDIPIIEESEVFLTRAGDKIIDQLFTFERHGQLLTLRPEFTAAAVHRYVQQDQFETVRWQFQGPIFEDNPSQPFVKYQHYSIGAELFGIADIHADAEIIGMAVSGIKESLDRWKLVIGHVGLQSHLLSRFKLDTRTYRLLLSKRNALLENGFDAVMQEVDTLLSSSTADAERNTPQDGWQQLQAHDVLDVLLDSTGYGTTMGGRTRHDIAKRLLSKHERAVEREEIADALKFLKQWLSIDAPIRDAFEQIQAFIEPEDKHGEKLVADWMQLINLLDMYGVPEGKIYIQTNLAKNWEYYTGLVFGIYSSNSDQFVASGGRYDELVGLLGNTSVPAVGFAYYVDPLLDDLVTEESQLRFVTITNPTDNIEAAIRWATHLRERDMPVQLGTMTTSHVSIDIQIDEDGNLHYNDDIYPIDSLDRLKKDLEIGL